MSVEGNTTMVYYSIDHPDPENNFTVTVVPINVVGPGQTALKVVKIHTPFKGDELCTIVANKFVHSQ